LAVLTADDVCVDFVATGTTITFLGTDDIESLVGEMDGFQAATAGQPQAVSILSVAPFAVIEGGGKAEPLEGSDDPDLIKGGGAADTLFGGADRDMLLGGGGADLAYGEGDDDEISGEGGNDTLRGDDGNDTLDGGDGEDWPAGEGGDDSLNGGEGRDVPLALGGTDTLAGGGGADEFILMGPGNALVSDFEAGLDGWATEPFLMDAEGPNPVDDIEFVEASATLTADGIRIDFAASGVSITFLGVTDVQDVVDGYMFQADPAPRDARPPPCAPRPAKGCPRILAKILGLMAAWPPCFALGLPCGRRRHLGPLLRQKRPGALLGLAHPHRRQERLLQGLRRGAEDVSQRQPKTRPARRRPHR
jgi:hypothetical protein